jgi:hypothetical protein
LGTKGHPKKLLIAEMISNNLGSMSEKDIKTVGPTPGVLKTVPVMPSLSWNLE